MRPKGSAIETDRLLDAGEAVVLRQGVNALTLDAVAAEAGVSKGGLLYHFPSKERLLAAMVDRIVRVWRTDLHAAIDATEPGPGRIPRAWLRMCLEEPCGWDDCVRRASVVLLAALSANPELIDPMRAVYREIDQMVRADGLKPGYAEVVLAALDGLWFSRIFGLDKFAPDRLEPIRACLHEVVTRGISTSPAPSTPAPSTATTAAHALAGKERS